MQEIFELLGKVLSFLGGAVLTVEALQARKSVKAASGGQALLSAGAGGALRNPDGTPIRNEVDLRVFLSGATVIRARIGLILITCGFLLEIVGLLIAWR